MKLLALILGLVLERIATQSLHLREQRWLDAYFDFGLAQARRAGRWPGYFLVGGFLVLPLLPVLLLSLSLQETGVRLWDLAYLAFAVAVIFFCLGPRDLGSEVEEYCAALDRGDEQSARRALREIAEEGYHGQDEIELIEEAIFIQANNRLFGVVFWFVVLGPVGAWLFRVSDLFRRRMVFEAARDPADVHPSSSAVAAVHGMLGWIPARLAALGYALSGSFDDALNSWRNYRPQEGAAFYRSNDEISGRVGRAAMTGFLEQPANSSAAARNSLRLVGRTLFIWVTLLAAMTILGWAV
jgi:membrane protein required for beta-lactamase induction